MGSCVGSELGFELGSDDGSVVGSELREDVGSKVGVVLGSNVGLFEVGSKDGIWDGSMVDIRVGDAVGISVAPFDGDMVTKSTRLGTESMSKKGLYVGENEGPLGANVGWYVCFDSDGAFVFSPISIPCCTKNGTF